MSEGGCKTSMDKKPEKSSTLLQKVIVVVNFWAQSLYILCVCIKNLIHIYIVMYKLLFKNSYCSFKRPKIEFDLIKNLLALICS